MDLQAKHRKGELTLCSKEQRSKRRHSSDVWEKFKIIKYNDLCVPNFVFCTKCEAFCSYNGSTTTRLIAHKCIVDVNQNSIDNIEGFEVEPKKPKIKFTQDDLKIVRNAASKFIVKDLRPFYAIEGEGLISLIQSILKVSQNYPNIGPNDLTTLLPSRNTLRSHVENSVKQIKEKIKNELQKALKFPGEFSISVDLWKDNYRGNTYAGIISHLNIEENKRFIRKSFVCCVKEVPELTKTNMCIKTHIENVFESYGVPPETFKKRVKRISDRGKNVLIALTKEGETRLNCYAHLINNLVGCMCKIDSVSQIVKNASALVKFMKSSGANSQLPHTLKSYVTTRWNTVYYLLKSINQNYDEIHGLLTQKEIETKQHKYRIKLTCINQCDISVIINFLEIFTKLTLQLEGQKKITLHNVWPSFDLIKSHLSDDMQNEEESDILLDMKKKGREYFTTNLGDFLPHDEHKLACFLHPLMKGLSFAGIADKIDVQNLAETRMESYANDNLPLQTSQDNSVILPTNSDSLFSNFMDCAQTNNLEATYSLHLQSEISNYLLFNVSTVSFIT